MANRGDQKLGYYLTCDEVCERLKFTRQTMWRRIREGTFPKPAIQKGKLARWASADIIKWIEGT